MNFLRIEEKFRKRLLYKLCLVITCFVLVYACFPKGVVSFVYTVSQSVPYRLFVKLKRESTISKGSFVLFHHTDFQLPLVKYVRGLSGDKIEFRSGKIFVDGADCGEVIGSSQETGKEYHHISDQVIPEGYVYVHGSHPESFDSRYEEFGLIPTEDIEGVVWAIL